MRGDAFRNRARPVRWPRQRRDGAVLLEVIVALTVLTIAGAAAAAMADQAMHAAIHVRSAERDIRRASAFLDAVALWPREDLDRHLGDHREGSWVLRVDRPTSTIYVVTLSVAPESATALTGGRELLRTALFRPELLDAPQ